MSLRESLIQLIRPVDVTDPELQTQTLASRGLTSTLGLVSQGVSRVVTNLVIGRLGGPNALGVVASALSVAHLAVLAWPASVGSAAAKFIPQARGRGDFGEAAAVAAHLRRRTAITALILAAVVSPLWALSTDGSSGVTFLVALLILTFAGQALGSGVQYGTGQYARAMYWDFLTSLLGLGGVSVMLLLGQTGVALLLPLGLATGVYVLGCWPWGVTGSLSKPKRRELDIFVTVTTIGALTSSGFYQLSVLASSVIAGTYGAGQYAAALALATPLLLLTSALSVVLFPSLAESVGRGDDAAVRKHTDIATRALAFVLAGIVAVLAIASRSIVALVWGDNFSQASRLLPIVLAAVFVTGLAVPSTNYLANHSQRGATFGTAMSLFGLLIGLGVWFVFVPGYGVTAVAAGYLAGKLSFALIVTLVTSRRLVLHFPPLLIRLSIGAAVVSAYLHFQTVASLPLWTDLPAAFGFSALWWWLNRVDVRRLLTGIGASRAAC